MTEHDQGGLVMVAEAAARALAQRLGALPEGPIRARAAARAVAQGDAEATALALSALARSGDPAARAAVLAVGQGFLDPGLDYAACAAVYAAAAERGLSEVTSLFLSPPPRRAWAPPRDPPDSRLAHLSLGHKKAAARMQKDPDLLARLAAEGAPDVVRELLKNPQLTEPFAIRIAARRPCRPDTLRMLAESPRWRTQPAVAMAIARNPYTEPAVALKLLAFLGRADLEDLGRDGAVHPLVRALAERLGRARVR